MHNITTLELFKKAGLKIKDLKTSTFDMNSKTVEYYLYKKTYSNTLHHIRSVLKKIIIKNEIAKLKRIICDNNLSDKIVVVNKIDTVGYIAVVSKFDNYKITHITYPSREFIVESSFNINKPSAKALYKEYYEAINICDILNKIYK